jgi:hypothetical protein
MRDLSLQQSYISKDVETVRLIREVENKIIEENRESVDVSEFLAPNLESSYNFKESLPFRAWYQALIRDRDAVLDETGDYVRPTNKTGQVNSNNKVSLTQYRPNMQAFSRPTDPKYLRHYSANNNNIPIILKYRYLNIDPNKAPEIISKAKLTEMSERSDRLNELVDALSTPEDLLNQTIKAFYDVDDFWDGLELSLLQKRNLIDKLLAEVGIPTTLNHKGVVYKTANWLSRPLAVIWDGLITNTGIPNVVGGLDSIKAIIREKKNITTREVLRNILKGTSYDVPLSDDRFEGEGYLSLEQAFVGVIDWANERPANKKKLAAFFGNFADLVQKRFRPEQIIQDSLIEDNGEITVFRLPINDDEITIDNSTDVITGWSAAFSNKFVPIYLQGFKYPYYQHVGSEDWQVSMRVRSQKIRNNDLKTDLSTMSDRVYDSVKVTLLNAPELIKWMDPRVELDIPEHHIFRCLGITHVIYNSANVQSAPNSPNLWDMQISLSQAQFTLDQYHAPVEHLLTFDIENIIASILLRTEYDEESNQFIVYNYFVKDSLHHTLFLKESKL